MNYEKIYCSLIEKARSRALTGYKEVHHVVPRCMGGTDDATNLVELSAEEHYIAHQLLVKIYPGNQSLIRAAAMMIPNRPSNKMYGWLRRRFAIAQSIKQTGSGNSQFGTIWVYHDLIGARKINARLIDEYLWQGWTLGRKSKVILKRKDSISKQKRSRDEETYREYYKIYSLYGFEKFVEKTGYKFSKANLVQRFAKLLPEFKPQNGKKRIIPRNSSMVHGLAC